MRTVYILAVLATLGLIGVVSWATLGTAQPDLNPPMREIDRRNEKKAPTFDPPLVIPVAPAPPLVGNPKPEPIADPNRPPVEPIAAPVVSEPVIIIPKVIEPLPIPTQPPVKSFDPIVISPKTFEPLPLPNQPPGKTFDERPLKLPDPNPIRVENALKIPTTDNPPRPMGDAPVGMGKTESSVSLEWVGPSSVKVGVANEYLLVVRNTGSQPVQKVSVQMRVPTGVTVVGSEPKADDADGVSLWEIGALGAREDRRITVKMMCPQRGDVACQAWVSFTGSSVMKLRVREPKLQVKLQAPDKTLIGDPAAFSMTVSNPGDHPTDRVKITAILADGLESVRGSTVSFDVGTLGAGESRMVTIPCVTKALGQQKCEAFAEADGGLKASDSAALNVVQPRLDLAIIGPKMRYEGKKASYVIKITNPGDAPAANVFIIKMLPNGFKFQQADSGGLYDDATRSVKWFMGELGTGESREVRVDLLAASQGEFVHKVMAHASRGMKVEQQFKSVVEGLSAISMELIDTDDPVEVGFDTSYEIRIANTGTKAETDVKLVCTLPPQLKIKSVAGPLQYEMVGNEITFKPLARLAPRADVVIKVMVTAVAKGDARFKASLTTASIVEPVTKVEVTKVYSD